MSVELTDSDSLVCSVGSKRDHKYGRWDEGKQHKRGPKRSRGSGRCKTNVIADAIDAVAMHDDLYSRLEQCNALLRTKDREKIKRQFTSCYRASKY